MSYRSILVDLNIDGPVAPLVELAADLAARFDARLIGLSAAEFPPPMVTSDGMVFDGEVIQVERENIEKQLDAVRAAFERLVGTTIETEWRSAVFSPTRFLVDSARAADLVVMRAHDGGAYRAADAGSVVLAAGRPVLVVAADGGKLGGNAVLVAWKDAREARRAVTDALPFLVGAGEVVVATVDRGSDPASLDSLADVAIFLGRHGVAARTEVLAARDEGDCLVAFARSIRADLIVSGAYGHSRLREWAFGGVTRRLLQDGALNRFMSY